MQLVSVMWVWFRSMDAEPTNETVGWYWMLGTERFVTLVGKILVPCFFGHQRSLYDGSLTCRTIIFIILSSGIIFIIPCFCLSCLLFFFFV